MGITGEALPVLAGGIWWSTIFRGAAVPLMGWGSLLTLRFLTGNPFAYKYKPHFPIHSFSVIKLIFWPFSKEYFLSYFSVDLEPGWEEAKFTGVLNLPRSTLSVCASRQLSSLLLLMTFSAFNRQKGHQTKMNT